MTTLFQFELEGTEAHLCIPMSVRLKLDCCGLKVTTQQWQRLNEEEKHLAASTACQITDERNTYRRLISGIILDRTGEPAGELLPEPKPAWLNEHSIPNRLQDAFIAATERRIALEQWTALTPLQRFALIKLTRPGHEMTSKFLQALQEFGL
jgi:hypothetical protein